MHTTERLRVSALVFFLSATFTLFATTPCPAQQESQSDTTIKKKGKRSGPAVSELRSQARRLRRFVKHDWPRRWLKATKYLPDITTRTLYYDVPNMKVYSEKEAEALDKDKRAALQTQDRDGNFYYNTKHGTPLAYTRAFDVLAAEGFKLGRGTKVLDYGYGSIGQLRLMASLGADVVGIEVDPELRALYSYPGDQGKIKGAKRTTGSLRLIHGFFPADAEVKQSVGTGYDLIMSKNVLKNGYIHPARPVDKRRLLDLGVPEQEFVQILFDLLNPGGYVLIYNLCPPEAGPDEPYIPWADGRSPFSKEQYESAGFEVLVFNRVDNDAAREMGRLLGWDEGPYAVVMEQGLFAWYTIVRKPESK
jgi:hypothetical protein